MGKNKESKDSFLKFSKPRISQAVKDVVKTSNRSSDLHTLTTQFDVVKIKLSQLIEALKMQHQAMKTVNRTRLTVSDGVMMVNESL